MPVSAEEQFDYVLHTFVTHCIYMLSEAALRSCMEAKVRLFQAERPKQNL